MSSAKRPRKLFEIHRADSLEWLKATRAKSFQAVVTDPPFGVKEYLPEQLEKRKNGNGGIWRLPQDFDGCKRSPVPRFTVLTPTDRIRISRFHEQLARELLRVLVPGGHVLLASQTLLSHLSMNAFVGLGFELRGQIVRVVKTFRGGDRPKDGHEEFAEVSVIPRSCWEPWLVFRRPCEGRVTENLRKWGTGALRRPCADQPFTDLLDSSRPPRAERAIAPHPSLKPQAFLRMLVRAALPLGKGKILDPFMGSGSTIAAALSQNIRSVGVEINSDYYRMARRAIPKLAKIEPNR